MRNKKYSVRITVFSGACLFRPLGMSIDRVHPFTTAWEEPYANQELGDLCELIDLRGRDAPRVEQYVLSCVFLRVCFGAVL